MKKVSTGSGDFSYLKNDFSNFFIFFISLKTLMEQKMLDSVKEIAFKTGFENPEYFFTVFKKKLE